MATEDFSLQGKVAIVTGSGRGIGAGIAKKFAEAGAAVVVTGRTVSQIEGVAAEITDSGGRAIPFAIDFNQTDQFESLVDKAVGEFGGLDILVNSAGGSRSPAFLDTRIEDLTREFHLITVAAFELSRVAVPHMLKRPGASIINIIGPAPYRTPRGNLSYYTAKAALGQMTKLMAADLGPKIRVNGIMPGAVETPAIKRMFMDGNPEFRALVEGSNRMRRFAKTEEIGAAAVYLASPMAGYVTGVLLPVDGGIVDEVRQISPDL
jgi:7-alpha-hydroxysteroid dehydrogenase